jgi:hypothetical protein
MFRPDFQLQQHELALQMLAATRLRAPASFCKSMAMM